MQDQGDHSGQAWTQELRGVVSAALPPGEAVRHAGWVVQTLGARSRKEESARINRSLLRPSSLGYAVVEDLSGGTLSPSAPVSREWRLGGRAGALFGPPGSIAALVDGCLPFVEANPVVLTVTSTSLVILWPASPLPLPPPPPAVSVLDFALWPAHLVKGVWDASRGRPVKDKFPAAHIAPIPSPAPPLTVRWQLPLSYVASVTASDTSLYGIVDATFTDSSRLRIATPTHDQDAFAAAIIGRTG